MSIDKDEVWRVIRHKVLVRLEVPEEMSLPKGLVPIDQSIVTGVPVGVGWIKKRKPADLDRA